jgi:hypothetical protein
LGTHYTGDTKRFCDVEIWHSKCDMSALGWWLALSTVIHIFRHFAERYYSVTCSSYQGGAISRTPIFGHFTLVGGLPSFSPGTSGSLDMFSVLFSALRIYLGAIEATGRKFHIRYAPCDLHRKRFFPKIVLSQHHIVW